MPCAANCLSQEKVRVQTGGAMLDYYVEHQESLVLHHKDTQISRRSHVGKAAVVAVLA